MKKTENYVVLIDLELPEIEGITATEIIANRFPDGKVLVLNSHENKEELQKLLQSERTGYLLNPVNSTDELSKTFNPTPEKTICQKGNLVTVDKNLTIANSSEIAILDNTNLEIIEDWSQSVRASIDTIPRVSLRAILYIFLLLLTGLIPWLMLAKVDEIGAARGRLEPLGKVIRLDSPVGGTVKSIEVKEGQQIVKGANLLKLDSEAVKVQLQQEKQKLTALQDKLDRLESVKERQSLLLQAQKQQNQAQQFEKQALIDQARQNLTFLHSNNHTSLAEQQAKLEQAKQAIETTKSANQLEIIRAKAAKEKVPRYRTAFEQGALSRDLLAEAEQNAQESQANIAQTQSEIERSRSQYQEQQQSYDKLRQQLGADIEQAKLRLQEQERGYKSMLEANNLALLNSKEEFNQTEAEIATVIGEIALTKSSIEDLEYQLEQRTILAPVSGILYQLPIAKPGAVVQIGQTVAQIAPQNSPLILRAKIDSQESGFLTIGLPVKLKFDAYPFQDYGSIPGHLTWISPDSRIDDSSSSEPKEFYEIEIELDRNYIQANRRRIFLTPGQTASAEVVIRQQRLADLLLAPIKSLQKGGLQL